MGKRNTEFVWDSIAESKHLISAGEAVGAELGDGKIDKLEEEEESKAEAETANTLWSVILAEEICEFYQIPLAKRVSVAQMAIHSPTEPEPYAEYLLETLCKVAIAPFSP